MPIYSIRDLENLTGVQAHTIRIWEQRYNILSPERTPTNIRRYSDKELRKLLSVVLLNNNGLKISKIANLSDTEIAEAVLRLSEGQDSSVESQIEALKLVMIDMNETKFEKLFSHLVLQLGFEDAVLKIFIPFFKRLTCLWQTESVTMAQLNFISTLYKQKLFVAIDGLTFPDSPNKKKFIIFLPKTEWLDSGLFCDYMARKRGHPTLYLGSLFSADEIVDILQKNPGCCLFSVAALSQSNLTEYYGKIVDACTDGQQLLVIGNQPNTVRIEDGRLTFLDNYYDFKELLNKL
jgi:DNA-binding transcriptional MerR regulator